MKINVTNKDLGFFTQDFISVKRLEGGEIIFCNHAGANEEEVINYYYTPDARDLEWKSTLLVCDKCEAYKPDNQDYWENAPEEGRHE